MGEHISNLVESKLKKIKEEKKIIITVTQRAEEYLSDGQSDHTGSQS